MKTLLIPILTVFIVVNTTYAQTTYLTVGRHVDTPFTNESFDSAMAFVNIRLRMDDQISESCVDVPCTARFQRSGDVTTFGTSGDGFDIISTSEEMEQLLDGSVSKSRVNVVSEITFCDGYNPSAIGCSRQPGYYFVVEAWVVNGRGDVFLHEYGHTVGLGHRDNCGINVMAGNKSLLVDGRAVDKAECEAFGGRVFTEIEGIVFDGFGGPLTPGGGPYWVTGDVIVPSGTTLTIQPGVEIQFKSEHKIAVYGTLNADGRTKRILLYAYDFRYVHAPSLKIDHQLRITNGGQLYLHGRDYVWFE